MKSGVLTRQTVKTGMVGSTYTQIKSGVKLGQSVVLADLATPVPSSNDDTTVGGGLGGGGFTGFTGGGGRFVGGGGGVVSISPAGG
jgi:hypothetical protein